MSRSPSTPGPWTVRRRRRRRAGDTWQVVAAGAMLAELAAAADDGDPAGTSAANARLMAAAPRLLASLRILSLLLHRHFAASAAGPRPDRRLMLAACAAVDAVIADAEDRPVPARRPRAAAR